MERTRPDFDERIHLAGGGIWLVFRHLCFRIPVALGIEILADIRKSLRFVLLTVGRRIRAQRMVLSRRAGIQFRQLIRLLG